jgi:tRNA splicing endonuclease
MGEKLKEIESTFTLPERTVTVKYINRKKGMASNVGDDHVISGGMLSGSVKRFQVPLLRNGSLKNVLTNEEKEFLESRTGLNLSIYGEFWSNHFVALFKDDNRLDLSDPMDYLSYKILMSLKDDIAPSWSERNVKQTYQFVVTSSDEELTEKKQGLDNKKEAFKLYGKIEDDKEKLIGILKLLTNKPISKDATLKWLQSQVEEFLDKKPESFVAMLKDSKLETKLLVQSAEDKGVIVKSGNKYATSDGLDLCENGQIPTFENAIAYLDNPKHQEVRSLIEAKLSSKK